VTDVKRRPIADFFAAAREQPNIALGVGVGAIIVIALIVVAITHTGSGADQPSRSAAAASHTADGAGDPNGAGSSSALGASPSTHPTSASHDPTTTTISHGESTPTLAVPDPAAPGGSGAPPAHGPPRPKTTPTRPPTPGPLPASDQRWRSNPTTITLAPGAVAHGLIIVANVGKVAGTVSSPGCPSGPGPSTMARSRRAPTGGCATIRSVGLSPRAHGHFFWTWYATQTGQAGAPNLAPGSYSFTVGLVTVGVTVT
jgi:hypothetical protein